MQGFGILGSAWVESLGVWGLWVWDVGFRVQGSGFRVQGSGLRVWVKGFWM